MVASRLRRDSEDGFTMLELVVALALFSFVAAAMAGTFWASMRTAGAAAHRTDGASIASREIEEMRAAPYGQVGFYEDQTGFVASFEGLDTVDLGATSPSSGTLVPQLQPLTPDSKAATGYAPDPNPANASPVVQGGVQFSVWRYIVWTDAHNASTTFAQAYKRLTVIVKWTDRVGAHTIRQDSIVYPGGQGQYAGPEGGTSTTTTTAPVMPASPVLNDITPLADPAGETQVPLTWSQPAGATITSYSVEYSTNASFPAGNFTVIAGLAPTITSYTVTGLTPNTTYWFEVIAYAGTNSATSNKKSTNTLAAPATCTLGALNVAGSTSLSTTGTILQKNGKMSENLTLAWTTTGTCTDGYQVKATDPSGAVDPGSPYSLSVSSGSYSGTVLSFGQKGWGVGLHTFKVWDTTTNSATTVVKTFTVCANGVASC